MRLHDMLNRAAELHPARPAIVDGPLRRSYADTAKRVRRLAAGLLARAGRPGAHVAILARNSHRFFETYFACAAAGLVAVPLNIRLAPAELGFVLDDAEACMVLGDADLLATIPGTLPRISFDDPAGYEQLIATAPEGFAPPPGDDAALAHLCYTGGTTGRPKGVMLSHRNVATSALNKIRLGDFREDDVWLHAAPMFHQADSWAVFSFTQLGATHVFTPKFDAARLLDLIETHAITATQIVPTMLFLLLERPDLGARRLGSLRRILYGSAPMPLARLGAAIERFGPIFQHIYGQTESAGTMTATEVSALREWVARADPRLASCGRAVPGVEVKVTDAAGDPLPAGTVGRIHARGPTVMAGYWKRPEDTRAALRTGWLDTGDLGRMDGEGYLTIVDRAKDMILSGGENVYSAEVEDALCAHPSVAEAAVIGLPDEKWGEAVAAIVTLAPNAAVDEAALIAHCRARIAGYKCPRTVTIVEALPKSAAGKVLKAELRAQFSRSSIRPCT
ncbi:MAG TPA: long-chain-fatty-acid--CoA ligase [Burkholderiales bacterium]